MGITLEKKNIFPKYSLLFEKWGLGMDHFPIYVKMTGKRVIFIGNGDDIIAKARLVMKTPAQIEVYATAPCDELLTFIKSEKITHQRYSKGRFSS